MSVWLNDWWPQESRGALIRCYALCPRDKKQSLGFTLGATLGVLKFSSPQMRGIRTTSVKHEQLAPGHNDLKEPWQMVMLGAAEKGKITPKNQCHSALGDLASWPQCHWSAIPRACDWVPLPTGFSHLPRNAKPQSALPGAISGAQEWPNAPSLIYLGDKKYFLHLTGHQWVLQNPGTPGNVSASHFLWLQPLALQRDENDKLCFAPPEGIPLVWLLLSS